MGKSQKNLTSFGIVYSPIEGGESLEKLKLALFLSEHPRVWFLCSSEETPTELLALDLIIARKRNNQYAIELIESIQFLVEKQVISLERYDLDKAYSRGKSSHH